MGQTHAHFAELMFLTWQAQGWGGGVMSRRKRLLLEPLGPPPSPSHTQPKKKCL